MELLKEIARKDFRVRTGSEPVSVLQALEIAADPVLGEGLYEDIHQELHREAVRIIHRLISQVRYGGSS